MAIAECSKDYNHGVWFFGAGRLPRWLGYSLGYRLVANYRLAPPSRTASDLVNTEADAFREGLASL